jgi:hypothetical protein
MYSYTENYAQKYAYKFRGKQLLSEIAFKAFLLSKATRIYKYPV